MFLFKLKVLSSARENLKQLLEREPSGKDDHKFDIVYSLKLLGSNQSLLFYILVWYCFVQSFKLPRLSLGTII